MPAQESKSCTPSRAASTWTGRNEIVMSASLASSARHSCGSPYISDLVRSKVFDGPPSTR